MLIFTIWLLGCLAIGAVAARLERSFFGWFFLSLLLSPVVGILGLVIKGGGGKPCPECSEKVKSAAIRCKHCGYTFREITDAKERLQKLDRILEEESKNNNT